MRSAMSTASPGPSCSPQSDDELVSSDASDEVSLADDHAHGTSDRDEGAIAGRMTELVVHALEAIEIAEEKCGLTRATVTSREREADR